MFFILSTYLLLVTRLSRCKAPGVVQVKLVENAVINIGLVRLFLYKWPKVDCGLAKEYLEKAQESA